MADYRSVIGAHEAFGHVVDQIVAAVSPVSNDVIVGGHALYNAESSKADQSFLYYFEYSSCSVLWALTFE